MKEFNIEEKKKIIISVCAAVLILAIVVGTVFAVKWKRDKENESIASASNTSEVGSSLSSSDESTESTKETSESTTEESKTNEALKSVTLPNSDKRNFEKMMGYIVGDGLVDLGLSHERDDTNHAYKFYDYDYKSAKALENAFKIIFAVSYDSFIDEMAQIYDWRFYDVNWAVLNADENTDIEIIGEESYSRDPRELFEIGIYYCHVEASYVDKVLKNVFNVKPDHNIIMKNSSGDIWLYYYDGEYYYEYGDGGDGAGPIVTIDSVKQRADGKYIIEAKHKYGNDNEGYSFKRKVEIIAEIKVVEDESLWSVYNIKTVK